VTFTTPPNLQAGAAYGLGKDPRAFETMGRGFQEARDWLSAGLRDAGFHPLPAEGTYFICVDLAASGIDVDDVTFCERSVREAGVAAIPISPFYRSDPVRNVIRLCFAKKQETLAAGLEHLAKARRLFS